MKALIVLVATIVISCPGLSGAGEGQHLGEGATERTTVKSGKSNSSDRVGETQDPPQEQAGRVKGSKSNTSERSTVKSSKSNSSD